MGYSALGFFSDRKQLVKIRIQSLAFGLGAVVSLVDVFLAPKDSTPGPWAAGILALLLLRRAITGAHRSSIVVLSATLLVVILVAGDHGYLNVDRPVCLCAIATAGLGFAFGDRLETAGRKEA